MQPESANNERHHPRHRGGEGREYASATWKWCALLDQTFGPDSRQSNLVAALPRRLPWRKVAPESRQYAPPIAGFSRTQVSVQPVRLFVAGGRGHGLNRV